VLTRTRTNDPRVSLLQERKIPFITHGRTMENEPHAWVDTDNAGAFELAARALIERGHRRIAFINGMPNMTFAALREQGFRRAVGLAGIQSEHCEVHYTELSAAAGEEVTQKLLEQVLPPTAIVCATDAAALGAMAAIRKSGKVVGGDVSVIGYGNTEAAQYASPPLTSIDHSIAENGRHIAQLLLRLMAGEAPALLNQLETPNLLLRESVAEVTPLGL